MPTITRARKGKPSFLKPEDIRAYCERNNLTQARYAYQMGISLSAVSGYLNGKNPVPYGIAKLMYFIEKFDDYVTGPADARHIYNTRHDVTPEEYLPYALPQEVKMYLERMDWSEGYLADLLGYVSFRAVRNWIRIKSTPSFYDAKLMQYFVELDWHEVHARIPGVDDIFDTVRPFVKGVTPERISPLPEDFL